MEEEIVGIALAEATELRLKISSCIEKATAGKPDSPNKQNPQKQQEEQSDTQVTFIGDRVPNSHQCLSEAIEEEEDEEETERLLNIKDGLESLEAQLVALQNLQHQQRYEKEVALAEIDYSRRILSEKLEEYRGKNLDVILEASAFVSKTVENNNDLVLPPYPSRPPRSLVLDNGYSSQLQSTYKSLPNGFTTGEQTNEAKKNLNEYEQNEKQDESKNSRKGLGYFFSSAVKTVLPLVGVIYILSLSNVVPNLGKGTPLKLWGTLQRRATEKTNSAVQCPPGKILVMESGEARCLVKERIEVPFESIVAKPDVNFGCG
ncbi:hypothetical protein DITRI_Ditri08aG0158900 [Diplodiscus trichospermus]